MRGPRSPSASVELQRDQRAPHTALTSACTAAATNSYSAVHCISHPCYQACAHRFVLVVTRRDAAAQPSYLVHASRAARCRARVAIAVVRPADSASASQSTRRNIAWCCCRVVDSTSSNSHSHVSVAVTPSGLGISKYGPTTAAERLSCVTALRGGVLSSTDACVRRRRHEIVHIA